MGSKILCVNEFKQRIKDCAYQKWNDTVNRNRKLTVFINIKHNIEQEKYLDVLREKKCISALAKFRCSNHVFAIETGRHRPDRINIFSYNV